MRKSDILHKIQSEAASEGKTIKLSETAQRRLKGVVGRIGNNYSEAVGIMTMLVDDLDFREWSAFIYYDKTNTSLRKVIRDYYIRKIKEYDLEEAVLNRLQQMKQWDEGL